MKMMVVLFTALVAVSALKDEEQWATFKVDFEKTYKSVHEESVRFKIFQNNLRKIEAHNGKYESGESTYEMGVNQFTDLTEEEVLNLYSMPQYELPEDAEIFDAQNGLTSEEEVDWRKKGAVLDVLDQGPCGSCYAFSALGALEGQRAIKHNIRAQLSEQEIVDCAEFYGPRGCYGGWMYQVWKYIQDKGISLDSDYKYKAALGICRKVFVPVPRVDVKLTGTKYIANNTEAFRQAVEKIGPVSITLYHPDIAFYKGGIFDKPGCSHTPTHAVLLVGYGSENGVPYWIVRNSWGKKWGENGYIRIKREEDGLCGIYDHGMFPVIE